MTEKKDTQPMTLGEEEKQQVGGEAVEFVVSYCGGPLNDLAGFSTTTDPLVLDIGSYVYGGAYEDTGVIMEWEPLKIQGCVPG